MASNLLKVLELSVTASSATLGNLHNSVNYASNEGTHLQSSDIAAFVRYNLHLNPWPDRKSDDSSHMQRTSDIVLYGCDSSGKYFAAFCDLGSACKYAIQEEKNLASYLCTKRIWPVEEPFVGRLVSEAVAQNRVIYLLEKQNPVAIPLAQFVQHPFGLAVLPQGNQYHAAYLDAIGITTSKIWFVNTESLSHLRGGATIECRSVILGGSHDIQLRNVDPEHAGDILAFIPCDMKSTWQSRGYLNE